MNVNSLDYSPNQIFVGDLKPKELEAILGYKDLNNEQFKWDYIPFPYEKPEKLGMDCFMINGYMRNTLKQPLTQHDLNEILLRIERIKKAIGKSENLRKMKLFRGYRNPKKISVYKVGDYFKDNAFISTSVDKKVAKKYSTDDPDVVEPVISILKLPSRSKAFYLGKDEEEWLLDPSFAFQVTKIRKARINGKRGLVYYIMRVKL